ncbi:MAG: 6-phosphofructokinase [Crocinitomicaceae bacterium]|jgi:6-phosphofructokinase 1|nr:6-phosphofructokinase [Crocinitomicaceae bacterium]
MKRVGLITSGGDSPGMNACIRAVVKSAIAVGCEVVGIEDGYQGMIEGRGKLMVYSDVTNIIQMGGTILGTARSKEFRTAEGRKKAHANLKEWGCEGLIVIGGDGSFTGAQILSEEFNLPVIGIPGTIDNDLYGTDHTIGYDTAINTAVDAIDKIRDTANSHRRIFFVEVMGRDAGFIALNSGIAAGADEVLIPEEWTDIKALVENVKTCLKGKRSTIIVVAEGDDAGGANDIRNHVAKDLEDYDVRVAILGHIQRGGKPTAFDRILSTRLGYEAVDSLLKGEKGIMIGVNGENICKVSLESAIKMHASPSQEKMALVKRLRTQSD